MSCVADKAPKGETHLVEETASALPISPPSSRPHSRLEEKEPTANDSQSQQPPVPAPAVNRVRRHVRNTSQEVKMANSVLAHVTLTMPDFAAPSSKSSKSKSPKVQYVSPASLVDYMDRHPNVYPVEDNRKIIMSILSKKLFPSSGSPTSPKFPLIVHTILSLNSAEVNACSPPSDDLMKAMADSMLTFVHDVETADQNRDILEQMTRMNLRMLETSSIVLNMESRLMEMEANAAEEVKRTKAELEEEKRGSKATITILTVDKANLTALLNRTVDELKSFKRLVKTLGSTDKDDTISRLQTHIDQMDIRDKQRNEKHTAEIQEIDNKCMDLEAEVERLKDLARSGGEGMDVSLDTILETRANIAQAVADKLIITNANEILSLTIDELNAQIADLRNLVSVLQTSVNKFADDLAAARRKIGDLEYDSNAKTHKIKMLEQEVDDLRKNHGAQLASNQKRVTDLEVNNDLLRRQIASLNQNVRAKDRVISTQETVISNVSRHNCEWQ